MCNEIILMRLDICNVKIITWGNETPHDFFIPTLFFLVYFFRRPYASNSVFRHSNDVSNNVFRHSNDVLDIPRVMFPFTVTCTVTYNKNLPRNLTHILSNLTHILLSLTYITLNLSPKLIT